MSPLFIVGVVVVLGVAGWLIYLSVKKRPPVGQGDPMSKTARLLLAMYLIAIGLILMGSMWKIGTIDFSDTGLAVETKPVTSAPATSATTTAGTASGASPAPVLDHLFSQTTPVGAVSVLYITAVGDQFTNASKLRFNQKEQPTTFIDAKRIQAQLDQTTIDALNPISVDVVTSENGKTLLSGTIAMTVRRTKVPVDLLICTPELTRELQLFLLAILAGALGSFVHAIGSFADFTGNQRLVTSWLWWYITRPFLGAALATVFYAVLRGGFMAGTPGDAKSVNQFGVIAVGALVGMFADKASDKLGEIFDTLFKGGTNRTGKLSGPVMNKLVPDNATAGTGPITLSIQGDSLDSVTGIKFGDKTLQPNPARTKSEISVLLAKELLASARAVNVSVTGPDGESPTKPFTITAAQQ